MTEKLKHKIIKYLNSEFSNLEQFETEEYLNHIFFMKDGELIFYYNKKNGIVYISYKKIWSFLVSFFGLEYKEIQDLTKEWVEEHYKLRVTTTLFFGTNRSFLVEEHYKLRVTTTDVGLDIPLPTVEEHYKLRVTTTYYFRHAYHNEVEEHYKLETNDK